MFYSTRLVPTRRLLWIKSYVHPMSISLNSVIPQFISSKFKKRLLSVWVISTVDGSEEYSNTYSF